MSKRAELSYDVRVWKLEKYEGSRVTSHRVRWRVGGTQHRRTFRTVKLAEGFRAELLVAARQGTPFDIGSGLPASLRPAATPRTWLEHAMAYAEAKWPHASPRHRKGIAEALTDITTVITPQTNSAPTMAQQRHALYSWAFNATARRDPIPADVEDVMRWLERNSPTLASLEDATTVRTALARISVKADGTAAAPSTVTRKRATLHNVLAYAVELGEFPANPLARVKWNRPRKSEAVDRRVVVNPSQARSLIAAVWEQDPALAGFFASLYFAGLRPAEARNLARDDLTLPKAGWGNILLTGSAQASGSAWTDDGRQNEQRALKHRAGSETRPVPAHPELVTHLRRHLEHFATGPDGRLFVTRTGRAGVPLAPPYLNPVDMGSVYRAWHRARAAALTEKQFASMLARRPYDLRHACLSTWLNAGVPAAQVAEWAGHTVEVLHRVYARCVDGDDVLARQRIETALQLDG